MWVDFTDIDSAITMTKPSTKPTQMRTSQSPTIQTKIAFTGINFSVSQNTSLEKEVSQGTTLSTEVSSPDQTSRINKSQITTITSFSDEKDFKLNSGKHIKQVLLENEDYKCKALNTTFIAFVLLKTVITHGLSWQIRIDIKFNERSIICSFSKKY